MLEDGRWQIGDGDARAGAGASVTRSWMKMKMRIISDLGMRNADLGRGVAGGEWRVTRNEQRATSDFFGFPRRRGAAKGLFYRRASFAKATEAEGAEGAEDGPGGAGPYRSLNA